MALKTAFTSSEPVAPYSIDMPYSRKPEARAPSTKYFIAASVAVALSRRKATEAAMKYFVLGALASGFLLYGMSMLYGATGSLEISEVFKAIGTGQINKSVLVFGTVFVVAGLAFKLGAVPFHM